MTGFTFQSLKPQDSLSNELRSVIRDNVLQFYTKGLSTEAEEEVIEKYGSDHVAQIVTFGTMAARAAVRECESIRCQILRETGR